jgi:hypothetical protein
MKHDHVWNFIDPCCAWCVSCKAESYYGEIVREENNK